MTLSVGPTRRPGRGLAGPWRRIAWRQARGLTLLEVLLVLAVLVAIAGISWPALNRPLTNYTLRKAADQVRAEWCRARVRAMSTGRAYLFRYMPESDQYWVGPAEESDFLEAAAASARGGTLEGLSVGPFDAGGQGDQEKQLPEGVRFGTGQVAADARAQQLLAQLDPAKGVLDCSTEPILFYPDGTTSAARLTLINQQDRAIDVSLRGLTGAVSVGPLYATGEIRP